MTCEKCWRDAYSREMSQPMKGQAEHYEDLLKERENNPCTEREQVGTDRCSSCGRRLRDDEETHCKACLIDLEDDIK